MNYAYSHFTEIDSDGNEYEEIRILGKADDVDMYGCYPHITGLNCSDAEKKAFKLWN